MISNVHSLIHLVEDTKFFNCTLSKVTAFPFENLLGKLKRLLRSGRKPLEQLCSRLSEEYSLDKKKATLTPELEILTSHESKSENKKIITSIKYKGYFYTIKKPNNCVKLSNGNFFFINKMESLKENEIKFYGKKIIIIGPMFHFPTKSSDINIFSVSESINPTYEFFHLQD